MKIPNLRKAVYPLFLILVILWLGACSRTNEGVIPDGPQQLTFPNCELLKVDNTDLFGLSQSYLYQYEGGRLVQTDFYNKEQFNARKVFTYDDQGNLTYMLGQNDTLSNTKDTIVAYEFTNGLLSKYIHYDPFSKEVLTTTEYIYANGFLATIRVINKENNVDKVVDFEVDTDKKGNPTRIKLITVDGMAPPTALERFYEYDDQLNPYYKVPDFIDLSYFTQNNIVKTTEVLNGQTTVEKIAFEYYTHGLVQKRSSQTGQGAFISTFTYHCK
ncbi:MAG TPA: hypothetical protein DCS93_41665 [Microscillaceae bacterium]|nr:hypothetical protein [Microscillaceae bacterium]